MFRGHRHHMYLMKNKTNIVYKIIVIMSLGISGFTSAVFGIYIGLFVDAIQAKDKNTFYQRLIISGIVLLVNIVSLSISRWAIYKDSCQKAREKKNFAFSNEMNKNSLETPDISKFSSKIDLVYDNDYISRWLIVENVLLFIFTSAAIIYINWIMLIVAFVISMLPLLVPSFFQNKVQRASDMYAKENSLYLKYVLDILQGRREITRYGVKKQYINNHDSENELIEKKRFITRFLNYKVRILTEGVANSTFIIVFLVGGILVFHGTMAVGGVISIIQLMNNIVRPITQIATYKNEINSCKPVIADINQSIQEEEKKKVFKNNTNDIIMDVKNVSFQYSEKEKKVINNFSYIFRTGKKYLLQGESGIGKSTLSKLLVDELKPTSGTIDFLSKDEMSKNFVQYVDQKSYLFAETILNNIDLNRGLSENLLSDIINSLHLHTLDIEKNIDDSNGISGGQKSRICLARAIAEIPQVLIVDEPTAALDDQTAMKVMEYLVSLPITLIVVSHTTNTVIKDLFDQVILL